MGTRSASLISSQDLIRMIQKGNFLLVASSARPVNHIGFLHDQLFILHMIMRGSTIQGESTQ